jgi:hypothetical protein
VTTKLKTLKTELDELHSQIERLKYLVATKEQEIGEEMCPFSVGETLLTTSAINQKGCRGKSMVMTDLRPGDRVRITEVDARGMEDGYLNVMVTVLSPHAGEDTLLGISPRQIKRFFTKEGE